LAFRWSVLTDGSAGIPLRVPAENQNFVASRIAKHCCSMLTCLHFLIYCCMGLDASATDPRPRMDDPARARGGPRSSSSSYKRKRTADTAAAVSHRANVTINNIIAYNKLRGPHKRQTQVAAACPRTGSSGRAPREYCMVSSRDVIKLVARVADCAHVRNLRGFRGDLRKYGESAKTRNNLNCGPATQESRRYRRSVEAHARAQNTEICFQARPRSCFMWRGGRNGFLFSSSGQHCQRSSRGI
jgi:hypothetical protein